MSRKYKKICNRKIPLITGVPFYLTSFTLDSTPCAVTEANNALVIV